MSAVTYSFKDLPAVAAYFEEVAAQHRKAAERTKKTKERELKNIASIYDNVASVLRCTTLTAQKRGISEVAEETEEGRARTA